MKNYFYKIARPQIVLLIILLCISCENFVEVEPPNNQLIGSVVFDDSNTVEAAFAHIYSELRQNALTNGNISGLSYNLGHYTDELTLFSLSLSSVEEFSNNTVLPTNSTVDTWWDSSYSLIYNVNNIINGVENSTGISEEDKSRFMGEAYFLRGFLHFFLVNLFGDIPFIDTTDYRVNQNVFRQNELDVYELIINDFITAKELLPLVPQSNNFRPTYWVASAMLARTYLYTENWQRALEEARSVISSGFYELESDLNQVFVKESSETLWQLDSGAFGNNTLEGGTYIFVSGPPPNSALSNFLLDDFEDNDLRFNNWLGSVTNDNDTWYYPFKYKLNISTGSSQEYSVLFRLAELYLIASEASARLNNLTEAGNYINPIRNRAMLEPIESISQNDYIDAIVEERRIELFSEMGHRFFDLKRTEKANETLSTIKPNWNANRLFFPIPESELILNPNLKPQNDGY